MGKFKQIHQFECAHIPHIYAYITIDFKANANNSNHENSYVHHYIVENTQ